MSYNKSNPNGSATSANSSPVVIASDQAAVAVSAASLPLPTGAATAAKQPALGTAGAASADVLTIQGKASMTPVLIDGTATTQPVSAASLPLPSGAATSVLQTTGNTSVASIDTKTPALGQALAAASVPVILPTATITTLTPPAAITGFALDATLTGGTQRSKITDGTNNAAVKAASTAAAATDPALVVAISPNNTVPVSLASVPSHAVTNAGTFAVQATLQASSGVDIGKLTANQSVNNAQINGVTPLMGNGVTGTGSQRVTLSTDNSAISTAGFMSVKFDQTTVGTTNGVTPVPATSGGPTVARIKAAASTNATSLKASAGQLYGYILANNTAAAKYVKIYNKASSPTVGTDTPAFTIIVPASGGANVSFDFGIPLGTGIAYAITGAVADSDTTSTAADDIHGMLLYK